MNIAATIPDFNAPVVDHARKDFPLLRAGMTVGEALERIRREGVGERVIYFYAMDEQERLVGVVPTRRLLTASLETPLRQIMVPRNGVSNDAVNKRRVGTTPTRDRKSTRLNSSH